MSNLSLSSDYIVVAFYEIPFGVTFRFNKQWCIKLGYKQYVSAKNPDIFEEIDSARYVLINKDDIIDHNWEDRWD